VIKDEFERVGVIEIKSGAGAVLFNVGPTNDSHRRRAEKKAGLLSGQRRQL